MPLKHFEVINCTETVPQFCLAPKTKKANGLIRKCRFDGEDLTYPTEKCACEAGQYMERAMRIGIPAIAV